jgi:CelD/BcsL family acetyltransferase involved in cellulose biosynthesis
MNIMQVADCAPVTDRRTPLRAEEFGSFQALPQDWCEFVETHAATFDQTLPWFQMFEQHVVGSGGNLKVIGLRNNSTGQPLALLPAYSTMLNMVGPIRARGIGALTNYYSALSGPIGPDGGRPDVCDALALCLSTAPSGRNVIDLHPLSRDASSTRNLQESFLRLGYAAETYFCFGNWYLEVGGRSSREYLESLPGQVRSTLHRKGKKLLSMADVTVSIVTDPSDVDESMDAYERVYKSSWKIDEPYKLFIRGFCRMAAERGWLRLGLIRLGDVPIAAQLWILYRGTASIFKLAYDQAFAEHSAGSLLTKTLMQHVIDIDQVHTVDYLCGDDSYKRDWMSTRRERIGLRAIKKASLPGMINLAAHIVRGLRSIGHVNQAPSG